VATIEELLGSRSMGEKDAGELDGGNLGDTGLEGHIVHWSEVLDRWVKGVDTRLGRLSDLNGQPEPLDGQPQPMHDRGDPEPGGEQ
jgi:hypothetical protein